MLDVVIVVAVAVASARYTHTHMHKHILHTQPPTHPHIYTMGALTFYKFII